MGSLSVSFQVCLLLTMLRSAAGSAAPRDLTAEHPRDGQFSLVDGGSDTACRGANSSDNSNSYYILRSGISSITSCESQCQQEPTCKGIEYSVSGRCELWTRNGGVEASNQATGYTCLRFFVTTTTAADVFLTFSAMDGGTNRSCAGDTPTDVGPSYYEEHYDGMTSFDACKTFCIYHPQCTGVDYEYGTTIQWPLGGRCRVWTRPEGIKATAPLQDFACFSYSTTLPEGTRCAQWMRVEGLGRVQDAVDIYKCIEVVPKGRLLYV
jgi:hypothetical protein